MTNRRRVSGRAIRAERWCRVHWNRSAASRQVAASEPIDRAHRIGQARHVFAYRLIAKDTVEEKVAELQQSKRDLADAILSADAGLIRDLKAEDVEWLLS